MAITLNHTIVPTRDKDETAKFYSRIFGFEYIGVFGPFIVVRVNDSLCLDFSNKTSFDSHHYAFKVTDNDFDEIFQRIKEEKIQYGSAPDEPENMTINHNYGGRGVYFRDANGHLLEMLTVDYKIT